MPIKDKSLYPKNWKMIRERILRRSKNRCECVGECHRHTKHCPARQHQLHPTTQSKVVLTIAHLNHTPQDCRPNNLKAMCQFCHLNYDAKLHARNARQTRIHRSGQLLLL